MKRILLTLLITAGVVSCAKTAEPECSVFFFSCYPLLRLTYGQTQPFNLVTVKNRTLGPGVSVDKQGNLVIDAPLYVLDHNDYDAGLKPLDNSFTDIFNADVLIGSKNISIAEGRISGGRLSITIPIPDKNNMVTAQDHWGESRIRRMNPNINWFKSGGSTKIAQIQLVCYTTHRLLKLYARPGLAYQQYGDTFYYTVEGDEYYYTCSEGSVTLFGHCSGLYEDGPETDWTDNISLSKGWNSIWYSDNYDEAVNIQTITKTSKNPPANTTWVLQLYE